MPIYEYECEACGHTLEAIQKLSDAPLKDCPNCHKSALKKLISAAGFRLKGGGWYETDFKTGNKKNVSASDTKSGSGSSSASTQSGTQSSSKTSSKTSTTTPGKSGSSGGAKTKP